MRTRKQKWLLWIVRVITNLMIVAIQIAVGAMICYLTQLSINETVKCEDCEEEVLDSPTDQIDFRRIGLHLLPATSIALVNMVFPVLLQQVCLCHHFIP